MVFYIIIGKIMIYTMEVRMGQGQCSPQRETPDSVPVAVGKPK